MTRYSESLNRSLHAVMRDERVVLLGEDIADPYGGAFRVTKGLSTAYPDRVLSTPISEAGIVGFAIGLALRGYRPVVEIMFGDFLTLAVDQIVNGATKFPTIYGTPVPLVIRTAVGGRRGYGPTHSQCLETLFLNVPGLTIIAPSHCDDPGALLADAVLNGTGPTLFVEHKGLYPLRLAENPPAKGPPDVTLVTYGGMAPLALEAARNVRESGIETLIVLPHQISPLGHLPLGPRVVIAEEGIGWADKVAKRLQGIEFRIVQAKRSPIPAAPALEAKVLPQVADLEAAIRSLV